MTIFKKEIKNKDDEAPAAAETTSAPASAQAPASPAASTEGTDSSATK
jgi:hypothetical protein